jgi:hypothetical protein
MGGEEGSCKLPISPRRCVCPTCPASHKTKASYPQQPHPPNRSTTPQTPHCRPAAAPAQVQQLQLRGRQPQGRRRQPHVHQRHLQRCHVLRRACGARGGGRVAAHAGLGRARGAPGGRAGGPGAPGALAQGGRTRRTAVLTRRWRLALSAPLLHPHALSFFPLHAPFISSLRALAPPAPAPFHPTALSRNRPPPLAPQGPAQVQQLQLRGRQPQGRRRQPHVHQRHLQR